MDDHWPVWLKPAVVNIIIRGVLRARAASRRRTRSGGDPAHDSGRAGQPEDPPHPDGRGQDYALFLACPKRPRPLGDISRLPVSLKVLLENVLRFEDGRSYKVDDAKAIAGWLREGQFHQGSAVQARPHPDAGLHRRPRRGGPRRHARRHHPARRRPAEGEPAGPGGPGDRPLGHGRCLRPRADALQKNVDIEFERNGERYEFLRWGQEAFNNFRVVPPGTGICHQVNLEYLASASGPSQNDGTTFAYPDTLYGTDSHTTMVNGLGVLGWGVGGIEAEAAMLGQPIAMLIPDVIGFRLTGKLPEGATATDLVLTVTQMLRKKGVVGKFVEFFGPGLDDLALAGPRDHRQHGARNTARPAASSRWTRSPRLPAPVRPRRAPHRAGRGVPARRRACCATPARPTRCSPTRWNSTCPRCSPRMAGPKRPQDRVLLKDVAASFKPDLTKGLGVPADEADKRVPRSRARTTTSAMATW